MVRTGQSHPSPGARAGFLVVCLIVLLWAQAPAAVAETPTRDVDLVWSLPPERDLSGFHIHYGPVSRFEEGFEGYANRLTVAPGEYTVLHRQVRCALPGLDTEASYWVSVTAFDHLGNESDYSNEKRILPEDPSGGLPGTCQTSSAGPGTEGVFGMLVGWAPLFVLVPMWILFLRRGICNFLPRRRHLFLDAPA